MRLTSCPLLLCFGMRPFLESAARVFFLFYPLMECAQTWNQVVGNISVLHTKCARVKQVVTVTSCITFPTPHTHITPLFVIRSLSYTLYPFFHFSRSPLLWLLTNWTQWACAKTLSVQVGGRKKHGRRAKWLCVIIIISFVRQRVLICEWVLSNTEH